MTRARVLQEVRPMRFEELYARRQRRSLTLAEAGEMLGVTERTVRRGSGRYHAEGAEGVQDRRIGRLSARVVPVDEARRRVTRDDATTEISSAFFVEEEGTLSSFRGLREVMETQGLFRSLYTDRGSPYVHTDEAGGTVDKIRLTQGPRALQQLGVIRIPAYSPEARGRSARAVRTVQDRLPKELALAGMTELAAANRYRTEHVLPQHHTRFMVGATEPGTAFIPWVGPPLAEILCVQDERVVAKDNTVRYPGTPLQIPQNPHRVHEVTVTVRVHE